MDKVSDQSEIAIRLLNSGKYVWTISVKFAPGTTPKNFEEASTAVDILKSLDGKLRDSFPNHVVPGSGRVANTDDF